MKQQSGLRLTIIAVICGIAAAALTVYYLKQVETKYRKASMPEQRVMVTVVVPNKNLKKGSVITPKVMAARKVPQEFLPSNAILAEDFKKVMNRTLLMPLQIGRPITWEAVTGKSAKTYSENIALGRRSRSVKVNKIDSFDGLLRPGDHIDLMGNFTLSSLGLAQAGGAGTKPENIVMPILENVEVLAAGKEDMYGRKYEYRNNKNSPDGFNMEFTIIGLNLTPKQIARVELSEGIGDMFAVLRHPKDTSVADFKYVGVDLLFEKDEPASVDLVIGADGKPIGRVIGDNVVDENGRIIGKVVNGKAVTFDGKSLGSIIENVGSNDPMLQVDEVVDVVRDVNGNIIGKIVDGKIVDENGNVVGEIKGGQAVSLTGDVMGSIDRGVALDVNGNEVDLSTSVVPQVKKAKVSHAEQVVRDAQGNIIGNVINGEVIDANGQVIGKVTKSGQVQGLDGKTLGVVEQVLVDSNGNIMATEASVVRDAQGNIIGRVVNGRVIDEQGNVIGKVDESGNAIALDGQPLGLVEAVMLNKTGEIMASVSEVVRDVEGNIIGRVVDGNVVDINGNIVGTVQENGTVIGLDGEGIGKVEKVIIDQNGQALSAAREVVRDAQGNVIGTIVDGKMVDTSGNVIGVVKNGQVVDMQGNVIAEGVSISNEDPNALEVVRDAQGNVIGTIVNGKVVDTSGNVVGVIKNGQVVDMTGNVIADNVAVTFEDANELHAGENQSTRSMFEFVDFISGGTAKDGIIPVTKVRKE